MKSTILSPFFSPMPLFILLVAVMAFAGCTGNPDTVTGIVTNYKSHISSVNDYSMTVIQTMPGGSHKIDILYKRPYQYLLKHRYDPTGRTWVQSIHNLTFTEFQPESHTVDILAINNPETCFPPIADPNQLAFPVLFSGDFNLSEHGLETVNGREAYVIDAINSGYTDYFGEGKEGKIRIWIDREFWLVTGIQAFDSTGNLKTTFEVKNFTINSGISDNEFIITYPEGTKVRHPNQFC
jgi:outer membrane lipoprotein-sorting protein